MGQRQKGSYGIRQATPITFVVPSVLMFTSVTDLGSPQGTIIGEQFVQRLAWEPCACPMLYSERAALDSSADLCQDNLFAEPGFTCLLNPRSHAQRSQKHVKEWDVLAKAGKSKQSTTAKSGVTAGFWSSSRAVTVGQASGGEPITLKSSHSPQQQ